MTNEQIRAIALEVANDLTLTQAITGDEIYKLCIRFLAAITEKAEPDCWAVLTPNGSKLVSPQEAKGLLKAYPLFTHPAIEPAQYEKLRFALENCRLLAARHRKEDWALLILGFCAEGGVVGSPLRDGESK